MDKADYLKGVRELYAAEIEGEGLAARWLELATDPEEKYKLSLFLQLESEAKVRLPTRAIEPLNPRPQSRPRTTPGHLSDNQPCPLAPPTNIVVTSTSPSE